MRGVAIFSGTTEGRTLSHQLAAEGIPVTVCVATDYGQAEQGQAPGITVHTGRLEPSGMAALVAGASLCVDATHPYAAQASANIRAACEQAGVAYLRLLRPASPLPDHRIGCGGGRPAFGGHRGKHPFDHRRQRIDGLCTAGRPAADRPGSAQPCGIGCLRGGGDSGPQHHRHAGTLYPGDEPGHPAAVFGAVPRHQGRGRGGRF